MAKPSLAITSFNAGEFSPLLAGRSDLAQYKNACKKLLNFIPTVQGPVRRRPGTMFVAEVKNSTDRTWLRRFIFNQDQSYIIEFGDLYARFYSDHGVIEASPGVPYEIATPFTAASLTRSDGTFRLQFAQTGDVIYITSDGQFPVQKLTRLTATTFSIADLDLVGGPFEDYDPDQTTTLYASAATGAGIDITASAATFTSGHVGSLIYLEQKTVDNVRMWEAGKSIAINDVRRSDGKNYKALNAATTGGVKPIHSSGSRYDGDAGVQWEFLDPGYGWAVITSITSGTVAVADVLSKIPGGAVGSGNATSRWSFGSFSEANGWPNNVTFFRERLCFAKDLKVYGSVAGDFENFKSRDDGGLVTTDMAFRIDITSEQVNAISWMAPLSSALLLGTSGEEIALDEITSSDSFGPGNIKSSIQSEHGSSFGGYAIIGGGVVFIQAAGRKVRDMIQAESVEKRWVSSDATVLAEHITKGGVVSMAYQQEPDSVLWCAKSDGSLAGFTISREQEVKGWHPHLIGGVSDSYDTPAAVECVDVVPTGSADEVWMIVRRNIDGSIVRYVEYMSITRDGYDDPEDITFVDSCLMFNGAVNANLTPGTGADIAGTEGVEFAVDSAVFSLGDVGKYIHYRYSRVDRYGKITWHKSVAEITDYTNTTHVDVTIHSAWPSLNVVAAGDWRKTSTTISGLNHLEGCIVDVCGDGASLGQHVVFSGSIHLDSGVSKAYIGIKYSSICTPMPLESGSPDGVAQDKTKRISRCMIRFHETLGAKYGRDENSQLDEISVRDVSDLMDTASPLFTGDVTVAWPDGYDGDATITVIQDKPLPCTVVGLYPQIMMSGG